MKVEDYLSGIQLFAGLPGEQVRKLAAIASQRSYKRGEAVFFEGEEGAGFFVVASGRVKVFKVSSEGKEQILHIFGPGECFGEVSVFAGEGYPANASADSASSLLFFPRSEFSKLIRDDPTLALKMLAVLSMRLRRFARMIDDLSLKEVPGRLAAYLLYLSEKEKGAESMSLDISKGQLASLLGTIPETLSRILNKMNKSGLIRSEGSRIAILDRPALVEIARDGRRLT